MTGRQNEMTKRTGSHNSKQPVRRVAFLYIEKIPREDKEKPVTTPDKGSVSRQFKKRETFGGQNRRNCR